MQTSFNQKYYALLRSEEAKHRAKMSLKRSESALQVKKGDSKFGETAEYDRLLGTTRAHREYDEEGILDKKPKKPFPCCSAVEEPRPKKMPKIKTYEDSETFIDPSEGVPKVLDPVSALHLQPHRLRGIRELSFCDKNITALHHNFLLFEHLEVLFLKRNRLASIEYLMPSINAGIGIVDGETIPLNAYPLNANNAELRRHEQQRMHSAGPRGCVRLRHLDVSFNLLSDLSKTDIPRLAFLEYLHLGGNRLTDLQQVTTTLRKLRFLRSLVLERNPISSLQGYRSYVIYHIPQLTVLDNRTITEEERHAASKEHAPSVVSPLKFAPANTSDWTITDSSAGKLMEKGGGRGAVGDEPSVVISARSGVTGAGRTPREIVFGTGYVKPETPTSKNVSLKSGKKEGGSGKRKLWERSECVQLMEKKRLTYVQQKELAARREEEEAEGKLEEVRRAHMGFHGIWALCTPQMPLSEEEYNSWNTVKKPPPEEEDQSFVSSNSTTVKPTTKKSSGASSSGASPSGKDLPPSAQMPPASSATPAEEPPTITVATQKVLSLLPLKTWEDAESRRKENVKSGIDKNVAREEHAANHQGVLFDALLHRSKSLDQKTVHSQPSWKEKSIPTPERLAPMREAIQAAGMMLSDITVDQEVAASVAAAAAAAAAASQNTAPVSRGNHFSSSAQAAAAANASIPPLPLDTDLLRYIYERKSALVPPPWEHVEMETQINTLDGELQDHFLRMVRVFFTPPELQALEQQFGTSEILYAISQGLGIVGGNANALGASASSFTAPTAGTPSLEKEKSSGKKKASGKRGRNAGGANTYSITNMFLQDQQLLAMMTSPMVPSRRNLSWLGVESQPGSGRGAAGASAKAAAAAAAAAAAHSGVVGSYSTRNLDVVLNLLREDSHASELSSDALLEAICQAHAVDPATSTARHRDNYSNVTPTTVSPSAKQRAGLPAGAASPGEMLVSNSPALVPSGNNNNAAKAAAGTPATGSSSRKRAVTIKNGTATADNALGAGGATNAPADKGNAMASFPQRESFSLAGITAPNSLSSFANMTEKVFLSLNNVLGALLGYLPFVEGRIAFFREQCLRCAMSEKLKEETPEWFMRKQQAEMHRDNLIEGLEKSKEALLHKQYQPVFPSAADALADAATDKVPNADDTLQTFSTPTTKSLTGKFPGKSGTGGSTLSNSNFSPFNPGNTGPLSPSPSGQVLPQQTPSGRTTASPVTSNRGGPGSLESTSWTETNATMMMAWEEALSNGPLDVSRLIIPPTAMAGKMVQPVGGILESLKHKYKSKKVALSSLSKLTQESMSD